MCPPRFELFTKTAPQPIGVAEPLPPPPRANFNVLSQNGQFFHLLTNSSIVQVYLVHFVVDLELDNETYNANSESDEVVHNTPKRARSLEFTSTKLCIYQ